VKRPSPPRNAPLSSRRSLEENNARVHGLFLELFKAI
jgi:hypothetical protein